MRTGFDTIARLYQEVRPRYPEALVDALVQGANLREGSRLLEIGPGTGQATVALAKRGFSITAIELGTELAQLAREELKNYANVEVITGAFEEVELTPNAFDLIYAATAFHWIKPEVRFTKTFNLLKQNSYLAVIHTNHVSDDSGDEFFFASQPVYRKVNLIGKDENFRLPRTADLGPAELDEKLFDLTFFKAFPLVVRYSADRYAGLVGTFSPVLSMDPEMRVEFLIELSLLIEKQFGGSLQKHFAMTLTIARKKT